MHFVKETNEEKRFRRTFNPRGALLESARVRSKKNNIPFNITEKDIIIPDVCPYLKVPFQRGTMYAASLDKINPALGYVRGNIEVISRKANLMKNNASVEELLEFAYTILERH